MMTQLLKLGEREYRALPGLSGSELVHLAQSPAHLITARKEGRVETKPMRIGTLAHCMTLEGMQVFNERFRPAMPCAEVFGPKTKKAGQTCGKFFCGIHGEGKEDDYEYSPAEAMEAQRIRDAIFRNPDAGLILSRGKPEVVLVGHNRKGKIDWLSDLKMEGNRMMGDLKTVNSNDFQDWSPGVKELLQAGHYLNLGEDCEEVGPCSWFWIVAESSEPNSVFFYILDPEDQADAQAADRSLQRIYDDCVLNNEFPPPMPPMQYAKIKPYTKTKIRELR